MTILNLGLVKGENGSSYVSASTAARGFTICSYCTMQPHCDLEAETSCKLYVPPLNFRDPTGLSKDFCTIRMGHQWSKRVKPRSIVGLVQADPFKRIGLARVLEIEAGPLDRMVKAAIDTHHLFLDTDLTKKVACEKLKKIVRNSYGSWAYEPETIFTVLHLRRLKPNECWKVKAARTVAFEP